MRLSKNYARLLLSGAALIAAILYFANAWGDLEKYQVVFYYSRQITFLLACLIIPLSFIVIAFFTRNAKISRASISIILSLLILMSANVIGCGALLPLMFNYDTPLTSVSLKGNLYRLDSFFSTGVGDDHTDLLLLWQCDTIGLFCRVIYSTDFYQGMIPDLKTDPQNLTVLLLVNDKVVYTSDSTKS